MRHQLGLLTVIGVLATSSVAHAKIFDIYGQAQGGGGYGLGIAGAQKNNDFFQNVGGADFGGRLGAEILFVDAWVEHYQFTDFKGITGTWTQFMIGGDWDFPLGDTPEPGKKPKTYGEVGIAIGYGVGTGQQIVPPLDNAQLSDKGFLGQVSFGADYRLSSLFSIGITVPISYGYLFKAGNGVVANDSANQYQQINITPFVYLRLHLELK
jgi:hypothetical protein